MKKLLLLGSVLLLNGAAFAQVGWFNALIAQYSLDNHVNDAVSTPAALNGTNSGATAAANRNGVANQAYEFDGATGQFLSIGGALTDKIKLNTMTVSCWVRINANTSTSSGGYPHMLILSSKNPNTGSGWHDSYSFLYTKTTQRFAALTNNGPNSTNERAVVATSTTTLNQWYHLVMAFNFDSLYFYVNGVRQGAVAKGYNMNYDARPVLIGRTNVVGADGYLNGRVDAVRFYNRVLSPCEIFTMFTVERNLHEIGVARTAGQGDDETLQVGGVSEEQMKNITITPNPAKNQISIQDGNNWVDKVRITNLSGQVVYERGSLGATCPGNKNIDVTNLSTGMYLIECADSFGKVISQTKQLIQK